MHAHEPVEGSDRQANSPQGNDPFTLLKRGFSRFFFLDMWACGGLIFVNNMLHFF